MKRMEGDITARVPEDVIRSIEAIAKAEGLNRSDIVRRALRLLLSGQAQEVPALTLDEEAWLEIWRTIRAQSPDLGRAMMRVGRAAAGSLPETRPEPRTEGRRGKRAGGGAPGIGR